MSAARGELVGFNPAGTEPGPVLPHLLASGADGRVPIGPVAGAVLAAGLLLTVGWLLYLYR